MSTTFEIRQLARSVQRRWFVKLDTSCIERVARKEYEGLVKNHPGEYFELVKVTHTEECLEFTPLLQDGHED